MSDLAKACIEYRDARGPGYLDTCLGERMMDFTNDNPHVLLLILIILVLIMAGSWFIGLLKRYKLDVDL